MAEIMAVTNEAGYGSSIHPGWSLKFFLILTPLEGQEKNLAQLV